MLARLAGRARPIGPDLMYPAHDSVARARTVVLADGERVRVVEAGDAAAPPVVLVHGWGCSSYFWRHQISALAGEGWRALSIDLRGHGLSDRPLDPVAYSRPGMADHLLATLDALEVGRAPVIAHSMGGAVAVTLARAQPARISRLALFGAVGFGVVNRAEWARLLPPALAGALVPRRIPRWTIAAAMKHTRGDAWIPDDDAIDQYWAPTQFPDFIRAMQLLLMHFDWTPWAPADLASLPQPLLLVAGTHDQVVRPQRVIPVLARALRGAELHVADGAGHVIPEERPGWTLELLRRFLAAERAGVATPSQAA
jgi:pimeloyl-ACP methyl ester carboxylesterase